MLLHPVFREAGTSWHHGGAFGAPLKPPDHHSSIVQDIYIYFYDEKIILKFFYALTDNLRPLLLRTALPDIHLSGRNPLLPSVFLPPLPAASGATPGACHGSQPLLGLAGCCVGEGAAQQSQADPGQLHAT